MRAAFCFADFLRAFRSFDSELARGASLPVASAVTRTLRLSASETSAVNTYTNSGQYIPRLKGLHSRSLKACHTDSYEHEEQSV